MVDSKHVSKNSSPEWEVIREERSFPLPDGTFSLYDVQGVKRNDGFTVIREKATRNGATETFVCRGDCGEFEFTATRWNSLKEVPLDTYKVYLNIYIKEPDLALCKAYAKDIESALLHFPIFRSFNNMPVKKVIFEAGDVKNPEYFSAREL